MSRLKDGGGTIYITVLVAAYEEAVLCVCMDDKLMNSSVSSHAHCIPVLINRKKKKNPNA